MLVTKDKGKQPVLGDNLAYRVKLGEKLDSLSLQPNHLGDSGGIKNIFRFQRIEHESGNLLQNAVMPKIQLGNGYMKGEGRGHKGFSPAVSQM